MLFTQQKKQWKKNKKEKSECAFMQTWGEKNPVLFERRIVASDETRATCNKRNPHNSELHG